MFFGDPAKAFANIGRALRPGGRLALTVWQAPCGQRLDHRHRRALSGEPEAEATRTGQPATSPARSHSPTLPSAASLLQRAGFVDVTVEALNLPLAFGAVNDAQAFLETWMGDDLDDDGRAQASASLHRLLVENATAEGVLLQSATWLITARRPRDASSVTGATKDSS